MNNIRKMKYNILNKGFTLIEVLLVITLIGILLSIVLVNFNYQSRFIDARNDIRKTNIQTLESSITQYRLQKGSYPSGLTRDYQEICDPDATICTGFIDLKSYLVPDFIQAIPQDPNDTDNTGGSGYEIAVDEASNTVSIRLKESLREGGVDIKVNDPLPSVETSNTNTPLAATNLQTLNCPTGYIKVPGNSLYQTQDFCAMKYEAKAVLISAPTVGLTTPTTSYNTIDNNTTPTISANGRRVASVASGYPIANINQTTSATYCTDIGASLMTNAEWMTIARNIEGQGVNWTGGTVGSGGLWIGHSDTSPNNPLEANTDDNLGYTGTGNTSPSIQRRTHTLSNGEVIWDLSGNIWERTSDTIQGQDKPNNSSGWFWQDWTVFNTGGSYGQLSYDLTRPSNPAWTIDQNMGQYYAGVVSGTVAFIFGRGGNWFSYNNAGIFTLALNAMDGTDLATGFRCVLR